MEKITAYSEKSRLRFSKEVNVGKTAPILCNARSVTFSQLSMNKELFMLDIFYEEKSRQSLCNEVSSVRDWLRVWAVFSVILSFLVEIESFIFF